MDKRCPQCGEMIDAKAHACRHCSWNFLRKGDPQHASSTKNWFGELISTGINIPAPYRVPLAVLGGLLFITFLGQVQGAPDAPPDAVETPVFATVAELEAAYDANEVAADQKYGKRLVAITGVVTNIALDSGDEPFLSFKSDGLIPFQAHFMMEAREATARLKKGQTITVYCRQVSEVLGQPSATDCNL